MHKIILFNGRTVNAYKVADIEGIVERIKSDAKKENAKAESIAAKLADAKTLSIGVFVLKFSASNREHFVASVWHNDVQVGEISKIGKDILYYNNMTSKNVAALNELNTNLVKAGKEFVKAWKLSAKNARSKKHKDMTSEAKQTQDILTKSKEVLGKHLRGSFLDGDNKEVVVFGDVVDVMVSQGDERIFLVKDADGKEHFIPFGSVTFADSKENK